MVETLTIQTVTTTFNSAPTTFSSGGSFRVEVPQSTVTVAKPLSYQFRVAEYVDLEGKVVKVGLQVAVFEHDNYGSPQLKVNWVDVERVKVDYVAPVG